MTQLPPCIRRAVESKDEDAFEEILAYFKTYGTEHLDAVMWSLGKYTIDTYSTRRLTILSQVQSAGHFPCTPVEKPPMLSKYCTPEDAMQCPLVNPTTRVKMMVEQVLVEPGDYSMSATAIIKLKDGNTFVDENITFYPNAPILFFTVVARDFKRWYSVVYKGTNYPDLSRCPMRSSRCFST